MENKNVFELKFEHSSFDFIADFNVLINSDAHYLWDISEKEHYLECESKTVTAVLSKLMQKYSE